MRTTGIALTTLLALILAPAGALAAASWHVDPADSTIWFGTDAIVLHLDRWQNLEVFSIAGGDTLSVTSPLPGAPGAPESTPPFGLTSSGLEIDDFAVTDFVAGITAERVASPFFGAGTRLTFIAPSASRPVTRILELTIYDDHADAAVARARFANRSVGFFPITRLDSGRLRLDLSRAEPGHAPFGFLALQPTADAWGENWLGVAIDPAYARENRLIGGAVHGRGGMPFMDLWSATTGIALASLEPRPTALEFPCHVLGDSRLEVAIEVETAQSSGEFPPAIAPGDTLAGPRTAIIAHRGDFYDAAFRYGRLLDAALAESGRDGLGPYPASAWTPYWKTWGLGRDFTRAEIYARLDELADLGFGRVGLDDGWFDTYGGWSPDPAKFPAGVAGLKAFIADLHGAHWGAGGDRAFEVMLWWNPTGWEPGSGLDPSLLVRDAVGNYPVDPRGHPYLCPAYAPASAAVVAMVDRFMGDWGVDALYMDGDGLLNVPPCYSPLHAHARAAESCEDLPALYQAIRDRARVYRPGGTVILCECSMPHDPYKMPAYDQEDASDPMNDRQVRWKVKLAKAMRGGRAPVGDGYVDPMPYNDLSGTFANGLAAGAVLTTMYDTTDDLGQATWERWSALNATSGASRALTRNLYNLGHEFPEGHALERDDGSFIFTFFSDTFWSGAVTLRGLAPGVAYRLTELDTGIDRGTMTGPEGSIALAFHRQAPGLPWWLMLEATPVVPGTSVGGGASAPPRDVDPGAVRLAVAPNPARGEVTFAIRLPRAGERPAGHASAIATPAGSSRLALFDLAGRLVRDLPMPAAPEVVVRWDGRDAAGRPVAPGIYFARLSWPGGETVRRVLIVR